ncbi:MAG: hypothetical protein GY953_28740 [bacterium]|nr:hypothetical protein [bacterium]
MLHQEVQKRKPAVLIGTFSEGVEVARAIQLQLRGTARLRIWTQDMPVLKQAELESLTEILVMADFAILVHSGPEIIIDRNPGHEAARDKTLFEPDLFIRHLGSSRVFIVYDDSFPPRMTGGSIGVTIAFFDESSGEGLVSAVGPACSVVRRRMREAGPAKAVRWR